MFNVPTFRKRRQLVHELDAQLRTCESTLFHVKSNLGVGDILGFRWTSVAVKIRTLHCQSLSDSRTKPVLNGGLLIRTIPTRFLWTRDSTYSGQPISLKKSYCAVKTRSLVPVKVRHTLFYSLQYPSEECSHLLETMSSAQGTQNYGFVSDCPFHTKRPKQQIRTIAGNGCPTYRAFEIRSRTHDIKYIFRTIGSGV